VAWVFATILFREDLWWRPVLSFSSPLWPPVGSLFSASSASSPTIDSDNEQVYYANAHPYIEESLKQLKKQIPQLKDLQRAEASRSCP